MAQIKKILIANRAEIALRVIATAREMGIETVTIYSKYDEELPHCKLSDESYFLEGETLAETYLNQEKIIQIAKDSNCDAIHPGYGFLSENSIFANAVKKAGIIFIGPSAHAMEVMGDKKTSKQELEKIKAPLIPGYHGEDQDEKTLMSEAKKIGFPVLVKASAGGGGKGMRIVEKEADFLDALGAAKREAQNAFGNDVVLIEKYLVEPRHIEVQVIADSKGNTVHLFERECSIQRRYQKIVEETPSPALDDKLRKEICESAVKIAQGIGYENAGTVEFILDNKKNFYFLEMNTRLQVEHPITEMITGVDLVKEQIRVAQGDKLRFTQEDIKSRGHALELRIYAEDPDNDFLPTNGTIQKIGKTDLNNVRLDTGYTDGSEVSTQFDPMLAKLITYSEDRDENINKMLKALEDYQFGGVVTNRDYLKRILENKNFKAGKVTTDFVKVENLEPPEVSDEQMAAAIAMSFFEEKGSSSKVNVSIEDNAWDKLNGMRLF